MLFRSKLMHEVRARSKAHINYLREAWISPRDNSVRVTLDRAVKCEPEPVALLNTRLENPVSVFGPEVILELKFTDRFPDWFKELARVFGLMQCGAAKYVEAVTRVGEHRINRTFIAKDRGPDVAVVQPRAATAEGPLGG